MAANSQATPPTMINDTPTGHETKRTLLATDSTRAITSSNGNDEWPLVSVIIPVYNAALYLDECFQSVIRQTYITDMKGRLEVSIFDDGSQVWEYLCCAMLCDYYPCSR
jgi:cellulose synthase/poly-beta-1,6-N-acetylglucosamine synthase-like glycosyltransferase